MKSAFSIVLFLFSIVVYGQSYVDSGISHYHAGEYEEAMKDLDNAVEIMPVLTETAKAKMYYYRGLVWLAWAEQGVKNAEADLLKNAYNELKRVTELDSSLEPKVKEAYQRLGNLLLEKADAYLKEEKKAKELEEKLRWLDQRIEYLKILKELEVSSLADLYLGNTNKQAGDLIFEVANTVSLMQQAKGYYEEAIKYLELARYDDPFSKQIIRDLLELAKRLADGERQEEYEKLLELAGG